MPPQSNQKPQLPALPITQFQRCNCIRQVDEDARILFLKEEYHAPNVRVAPTANFAVLDGVQSAQAAWLTLSAGADGPLKFYPFPQHFYLARPNDVLPRLPRHRLEHQKRHARIRLPL